MHAFVRVHVSQVQCRAGPGSACLDVAPVRLDPTDARWMPARLNDDRLPPQRAPASVPVTTVPVPGNVNTRSTARRGLPMSRGWREGGRAPSSIQRLESSPGEHRRRHDRRVSRAVSRKAAAGYLTRACLVFGEV
jgi:hypothetical protein